MISSTTQTLAADDSPGSRNIRALHSGRRSGIVLPVDRDTTVALGPQWANLSDPWSPVGVVVRLEWVDPLSLAIRDGLPFTERDGPAFFVRAGDLARHRPHNLGLRDDQGRVPDSDSEHDDRLGWLLLAAILIVGGVIGPDSLGEAHGDYLPQRIVLMGLVALVPIFDIDLSRWWGRGCTAALVVAVVLQSAIVWDYAIYSDRTAGQMIRAGETIGHDQRIAALLVSTRSRFRSNPLLHADQLAGGRYGQRRLEQLRDAALLLPRAFPAGIDRPRPDDLEWVSLHEDPGEAEPRGRAWEKILSQHAASIDVVVVWKSDPALDAITARWFDRVDRRGDVQIFRRGTLNPN